MAHRIAAINAYRPRIDLGNTVQNDELVRYMADRSNVNKSMVALIVGQMSDAIIFFNAAGRGVKLEGLGTYLPGIDLDGTFNIEHRLDKTIKNGLNANNIFTGAIKFRENIGKTPDELVALWNKDHPDDPVS
jgi:ribosome-interacting GTPase 1